MTLPRAKAHRTRLYHASWVLLWAIAVASSLLSHPLLPIDETRYAGVAWEMWSRGDFMVPHLNGEPYSHKPPLLFWLIHLGWAVFGVNEWWPRLVPALFALGAGLLVHRLGRRLWADGEIAALAPLVLAGSLLWLLFIPLLMFDIVLTFWVLCAVLALVAARRDGGLLPWMGVASATALGILTKGPVMLLHVAVPALLVARMFDGSGRSAARWIADSGAAIALGAAGAIVWAVPAALAGGDAYGRAILWGQTSGRMVDAFAHGAPWWWYLAFVPLILFPWVWWPRLWRAPFRAGSDPGTRLCAWWGALVFVAFSLISGKRLHYLVPLFPVFALLVSRALVPMRECVTKASAQWPIAAIYFALALAFAIGPLMQARYAWPDWVGRMPFWIGPVLVLAAIAVLMPFRPHSTLRRAVRIACVTVLVFSAIKIAVFAEARPYYDLHEVSGYLGEAEREGIPIAHVGRYQGQYALLGRMRVPLEVLDESRVPEWVASHPHGLVVAYHRALPESPGVVPRVLAPYRGTWVAVWAASDVASCPGSVALRTARAPSGF